jgi:hypothetical protein
MLIQIQLLDTENPKNPKSTPLVHLVIQLIFLVEK